MSWEPPMRLVSPEVYDELMKALKDNCTQRQFELVAAGMTWDEAKKETPADSQGSTGSTQE